MDKKNKIVLGVTGAGTTGFIAGKIVENKYSKLRDSNPYGPNFDFKKWKDILSKSYGDGQFRRDNGYDYRTKNYNSQKGVYEKLRNRGFREFDRVIAKHKLEDELSKNLNLTKEDIYNKNVKQLEEMHKVQEKYKKLKEKYNDLTSTYNKYSYNRIYSTKSGNKPILESEVSSPKEQKIIKKLNRGYETSKKIENAEAIVNKSGAMIKRMKYLKGGSLGLTGLGAILLTKNAINKKHNHGNNK